MNQKERLPKRRKDGAGHPVFVVDDDPLVRRALTRLLKSAGYPVEAFESAEAFLSRGAAGGGGVLVLDVRMPGMSGIDLQERLAANGAGMPIVFITAHDDESARERALAGGARAFLRKPFDEQVIIAAVEDALRR